MIESLFHGIFDTDATTVISISKFMICIAFSLISGIIISLGYMYRTKYTRSLILTLTLLPVVVCVVIMMVNGNLGTGVAVAGAFSLVRFRSAPGTAKEITMLFIAMGAGLLSGMGYLGYSVLFTMIMSLLTVIIGNITLGSSRKSSTYKTLNITIPEDLSYTEVFDDIFSQYTASHELIRTKTANMGSLYKLTYDITLKDPKNEKDMIDQLRCRNGNLEISISRQENYTEGL